jgi:hypothetical protein
MEVEAYNFYSRPPLVRYKLQRAQAPSLPDTSSFPRDTLECMEAANRRKELNVYLQAASDPTTLALAATCPFIRDVLVICTMTYL